MMPRRAVALFMAACLGSGTVSAQPPQMVPPVPADATVGAIPLHDSSKGKGAAQEKWEFFLDQRIVRNVTQPALYAVLPQAAKATGQAMVIAPGGGYLFLSIDKEGLEAARWLADQGIAAFVLKYRVDETPDDGRAFATTMGARFSALAQPGPKPVIEQPLALADAQAAMRLVRARAGEWHIDPAKIGFMGFSAGARTGMKLIQAQQPGTRPDFAALLYGMQDSLTVPDDAPPLFAVLAADDRLYGDTDFGMVRSWYKAGRPIEFHYYEKGGHGFGMKPQGTSSDGWKDDFLRWLKGR